MEARDRGVGCRSLSRPAVGSTERCCPRAFARAPDRCDRAGWQDSSTSEGELANGGRRNYLRRGFGNASPIKWGRRVILTERNEVDGESRRQPAVTARADSHGAESESLFVAVVDGASRRPLCRGCRPRNGSPDESVATTRTIVCSRRPLTLASRRCCRGLSRWGSTTGRTCRSSRLLGRLLNPSQSSNRKRTSPRTPAAAAPSVKAGADASPVRCPGGSLR